jgi:transmembrane sensor
MTEQTPDRTQRESSKSDTEAVDWLIRLMEIASGSQNPTVACQEIQDEFNLWATRLPENLRSFLETAFVFEALGECEAEMIQELVAHIDSGGNIVSLTPAGSRLDTEDSSAPVASLRERVKRAWGKSVLAAAVVAMITCVLFWYGPGGATYRTQAGERQRIPLEDGSVVFLRELSELRVSFSATRRKVSLRGEAIFDVAHDARRPFSVSSDAAEILALGTRFDVEDRNGPTRVTVVDGSVRVNMTPEAFQPWMSGSDGTSSLAQHDSGDRTLTLMKYEGAEVGGRGIIRSDRSEVEKVVASQRVELMFDLERLPVVAVRFNLENRRQLRIEGPAASQRRISGRYRTDDPEGLVSAIRELNPDLAVRETEAGWVVEEQKP